MQVRCITSCAATEARLSSWSLIRTTATCCWMRGTMDASSLWPFRKTRCWNTSTTSSRARDTAPCLTPRGIHLDRRSPQRIHTATSTFTAYGHLRPTQRERPAVVCLVAFHQSRLLVNKIPLHRRSHLLFFYNNWIVFFVSNYSNTVHNTFSIWMQLNPWRHSYIHWYVISSLLLFLLLDCADLLRILCRCNASLIPRLTFIAISEPLKILALRNFISPLYSPSQNRSKKIKKFVFCACLLASTRPIIDRLVLRSQDPSNDGSSPPIPHIFRCCYIHANHWPRDKFYSTVYLIWI